MALLTVIATTSDHAMREALKDFAVAGGFFIAAILYWHFRKSIVASSTRALGESDLARRTTDLNVKLVPLAFAGFGVVWLVIGVAALIGAT